MYRHGLPQIQLLQMCNLRQTVKAQVACCNLRFLIADKEAYLRPPPKSELVEKEWKIKSLLIRHFIYANLGILVEVCKEPTFYLQIRIKTAEKHKILLSPT